MNIVLSNRQTIPQLGIGVYLVNDHELCKNSLLTAFACGYRHVDTAAVYQNEKAVGEAIKSSGLARSEMYLTSKIWVQDFGYEKTKKAIEGSLRRLQSDYVDLMLLHQPFSDYLGAWKSLGRSCRSRKD